MGWTEEAATAAAALELTVQIMDADLLFSDDSLGEATISLGELLKSKGSKHYELSGRAHATMLTDAKPATGKVEILVRATDEVSKRLG